MKMALQKQGKLLAFWFGLWIVALLCLLCPLRFAFIRMGLVLSLVGIWGVALFLFRRWYARTICAVVAVGALAGLATPGRAYDPNMLRHDYVQSLLSYKGTRYLWGGGNRIGIDCSGLVQRGLIDACRHQALATMNPALARASVSLWWHTRTARALGAEYRGETRLLFEAKSLNAADYSRIEPGDIAVMSDGVHTLAYVGDQTWIEADPTPMRVILARAPGNPDAYFKMRVRIMRWRLLERSA